MKMRTDGNNDAEHRHDWKYVRVIGELKQSEQDFKPLLLQLSRYARDVFTGSAHAALSTCLHYTRKDDGDLGR